jgi:hypothetical protein
VANGIDPSLEKDFNRAQAKRNYQKQEEIATFSPPPLSPFNQNDRPILAQLARENPSYCDIYSPSYNIAIDVAAFEQRIRVREATIQLQQQQKLNANDKCPTCGGIRTKDSNGLIHTHHKFYGCKSYASGDYFPI